MNHTNWSFGNLSIAALLALGCGQNNETIAERTSASKPAALSQSATDATLKFTVRVGADNELTAKTIPNATCLLKWEGSQSGPLDIISDAEGTVAFHDRMSDPGIVKGKLDCTGDAGASASYELVIQGSRNAPAATMISERVQKKVGPIRPAMTEQTALQMSDAELMAAHYPPRPDRFTAPDAYQAWLERVSLPATLSPISTSTRPALHKYAVATTYNWSGVGNANPSVQRMNGVQGQWVVPNVQQNIPALEALDPKHVGAISWSCEWVGMSSATGLYQAGTGQGESCTPIWCANGSFCGYNCAAIYAVFFESNLGTPPDWSWSGEAPPYAGTPGDPVFWQLWSGDVSGNIVYDGPYLWYYYQVTHAGVEYYGTLNVYLGPNNDYSKFTYAEWIVERQMDGNRGIMPHLSDFGKVTFTNAYAHTDKLAWTAFGNLPPLSQAPHSRYDTINMGDVKGTTLAVATVTSTTSFYVTWKAYGAEQ